MGACDALDREAARAAERDRTQVVDLHHDLDAQHVQPTLAERERGIDQRASDAAALRAGRDDDLERRRVLPPRLRGAPQRGVAERRVRGGD